MTLSEFKAWFEGFSETMEGAPNEKQWERIKERVSEINGQATPYPVFIDRYIEPYRHYRPNVPYWTSTSQAVGQPVSKAIGGEFNNYSAMMDLGKAEYKSVM